MSKIRKPLPIILVALALLSSAAFAGPITIDPTNPHYWNVNGQTIALVGVSGDYLCHVSCITSPGTVCDLQTRTNQTTVNTQDFLCRYESYPAYIADLKTRGLNKMRLYIGLNHSPGWQRASPLNVPYDYEEAFPWNGAQWDMSTWSTPFFNRVRAVLTEAQNNGVYVEVTLFDPWDGDFQFSPWNPNNNVQATGWSNRSYFASFQPGEVCPPVQNYGIADPDPRRKQIALLQRAVFRLNDFNNIYWEIANEPDLANPPNGVSPAAATAWHDCMVRQLYSYEAGQPNGHHAIAVHYHAKASIDSLTNGSFPLSSPNVAVVNSHYASVSNGTPDPYGANPMIRDYNGGTFGQLGRVFGFNEGRISPDLSQSPDRSDWSARAEAWEFMLNGGGTFDHLGYDWKSSSTAHNVRTRLGYLNTFLKSLSLQNMNRKLNNPQLPVSQQLPAFILGGLPAYGTTSQFNGNTYWGAMQWDNNQFVLYVHHSTLSSESVKRYVPTSSGTFHHTLQLQLGAQQPAQFVAEWINPATNTVLNPPGVCINWNGVSYTLPQSPDYSFDVALRIKRMACS